MSEILESANHAAKVVAPFRLPFFDRFRDIDVGNFMVDVGSDPYR